MADLIVRGPDGILVSLSTGHGFRRASLWSSSFSDASGWGNDVSYYGAIRLGDVNGDGMEICSGIIRLLQIFRYLVLPIPVPRCNVLISTETIVAILFCVQKTE
jgi:hypothetical protein